MRPERVIIQRWLEAYIVAIVALLFLAGCGASAKQKTLRATLTAVDATRVAFVAWDDKTQATIVEEATSVEEGRAKFAAHRLKRNRLIASFEAAYRTLALAASDPTDSRLTLALAAAASLWDAYKAVTGEDPPKAPATPSAGGE